MTDRRTNFLIYGANGYTGELMVRYAVERNLRPVLAGRNAVEVEAIATRHGLGYTIFSLDETDKLEDALEEVAIVLHCAGPFSVTARPMAEACLRTGTHYTDITGEISVFEELAALDWQARDAGIMLMPGVGFDVVPSDCLALHLKNRLPSATHLSLGFYSKGRMSHGTQSTMIMNVGRGGAIRKDGKIESVPAAWKSREVDFGETKKLATTIPWGDVATAYHSTGIPNIEVYSVVPDKALQVMKLSNYVGWMISKGPLQNFLQRQISAGGPTDDERAKGKVLMWGEATDAEGRRVEARLSCPEGYTTTALTALNITEKILAGNFTPGFQTPAKAYGADLILEIEGTARQDL
jgi:short subunit dehydrogenase-like uncharacterized protein